MKIFEGVVVSTKMQKTVVVEVSFKKPHPRYKKLLKRRKRYKVETGNFKIDVLDRVQIIKTRPISKEKHFKIVEVFK